MSEALEALLQEGRTFPPSEAFRKQALVTGTELYEDADRDWQGFWAGQALALDWEQKWTEILDWDLPFAKWFVGGRLNVSYNCLDRHVAAGHGDQVAFYWEGEPGDTRPHLRRHARRDVPGRQRAEVARRHEGRSRRHLSRHGSRARDHDARVRAHRRRALGRVRRVLLAVAEGSHQRCGSEGARHRRRGVAARLDRRPQGHRRRGDCRDAQHRARRRPATDRSGRDRRCEARRLVPRPRPAAVGRLRVRVDGRGRSPLPSLHERHDGQAQGHHAHDGWLPHSGRVHPQVRVRPASRHRRVLVHGRRRVGHRPLVRRLRTARQSRDERHVRRHTRSSRSRAVVVDRREVQGDDLLHRAHRDPDLHEVG